LVTVAFLWPSTWQKQRKGGKTGFGLSAWSPGSVVLGGRSTWRRRVSPHADGKQRVRQEVARDNNLPQVTFFLQLDPIFWNFQKLPKQCHQLGTNLSTMSFLGWYFISKP
jgi:hypothetical protein